MMVIERQTEGPARRRLRNPELPTDVPGSGFRS